MTTASRYATLADVLRDDEAVLHRAWIAHKTVHQPRCGEDCEAGPVLEDARNEPNYEQAFEAVARLRG